MQNHCCHLVNILSGIYYYTWSNVHDSTNECLAVSLGITNNTKAQWDGQWQEADTDEWRGVSYGTYDRWHIAQWHL